MKYEPLEGDAYYNNFFFFFKLDWEIGQKSEKTLHFKLLTANSNIYEMRFLKFYGEIFL